MKTVAALQRGLRVLRVINETGGCQIRDLEARLDLPKPTIIRMVGTLVAAGYVARNPDGIYSVTARVLALSNRYDASARLQSLAKPVLARLRKRVAWPSDLAVFDGDAMVILDTGDDPGTFGLNRRRGSRLPITTTSLGRAYLAFCEAEQREELLAQAIAVEGRGRGAAGELRRLRKLLDESRSRGYAISDTEQTRAIAVPILLHGKPLASVNLIVVITDTVRDAVTSRLVDPLRQAAGEISSLIEEIV